MGRHTHRQTLNKETNFSATKEKLIQRSYELSARAQCGGGVFFPEKIFFGIKTGLKVGGGFCWVSKPDLLF
jgi:hypothetical protein